MIQENNGQQGSLEKMSQALDTVETVQPGRVNMPFGSERFASTLANNHNVVVFSGDTVQKIVLGKDVALILPENPDNLNIQAGYPTHQESWLPMWFVLLRHSQAKTAPHQQYLEAINTRVTPTDRELVRSALLYKANEFWKTYQHDTAAEPRKHYKHLTRILQDILLYVDAPETVIADQDAYLADHALAPLIAHANTLRQGVNLDTALQLEEQIEQLLANQTNAIGKERIQTAYETLQQQLRAAGQQNDILLFPKKSLAELKEAQALTSYDLMMGADEHDEDVITVVPGATEPTFHQATVQFIAEPSRRRRRDIIAIPADLGVWDVVRKGKESYQPISMIVVTHTTPTTDTGSWVRERLQQGMSPAMVASHYLGAAEEFLHREAWGKSYVKRKDRDDLSAVKKVIPLYRVACDLLPRAIYMKQTGQWPAGVSEEDLWTQAGIADQAQEIKTIMAKGEASPETLDRLAKEIEAVFAQWYTSEDYDLFQENMKKMGSTMK